MWMVQSLEEIYSTHNERRGRGFIFGASSRVDPLAARIPERVETVLDLGCRDGSLISLLPVSADSVVGLDIDFPALQVAVAKHRLMPCQANLWGGLPCRSEVFDLVIAGELLEHLPFPRILIDEVNRVLRPGGLFIGSVPNSFRLPNRLAFALGRHFEKDPTHLRSFSYTILKSMLSEKFVAVEVEPCVGRFARWVPKLTSNDLVWSARKRETERPA